MLRAIDTNILVRLMIGGADAESARLVGMIESDLFIPVTVMLETEWVLRRVLRTDDATVEALFRMLLGFPNIVFDDRDAILRAIEGKARGMDFADALHQALSTKCSVLLTFDKAFIRRAARAPDLPPVRQP